MAYLDESGLKTLWTKVKNWTNSVHANSMTKGASSQDGLQLMLKNGAESPGTLSTVTITKDDITALGIPSSDTTYTDATQTDHGLMSAADKKKLDGVEANANHYVHPTSAAGAKASGLYKVATDAQGHVTGATAVTKEDITALGIPGNTYTHPAGDAPSKAEGLYKFSTDARSHVASVTPVTKADISPLESDPTVPSWAKAATKPTYNGDEIDYDAEGDFSLKEVLDRKQFIIDDLATIRSGAAKGATAVQTETDPTVPAWAKAATKPSYEANEIDYAEHGISVSEALTTLDEQVSENANNINKKAPKDSPTFTGTPTAPTAAAGTNTTQIATTAFVHSEVAAASMGVAKYKGGMSVESYNYLTEYEQGWYWVIIEAGTYAGESCEAGDMVFCNTPSGHGSDKEDCFDIVQNNIEAIPLSVINALS